MKFMFFVNSKGHVEQPKAGHKPQMKYWLFVAVKKTVHEIASASYKNHRPQIHRWTLVVQNIYVLH